MSDSKDRAFHAFEEWWALTGSNLINLEQYDSAQGCEVDAFLAGAEWMSESCATMVANYGDEVSHSIHAHVIRVVCNILAERIRKRGTHSEP